MWLLIVCLAVSQTPRAYANDPVQPQTGQNPKPCPPAIYTPQIKEAELPAPIELPAPPQLQADIPNRPLTAEEAARIAITYQPDVTLAKTAVSAAEGNLQQVQAAQQPTLGVSAGYTAVSNSNLSNTSSRTSIAGTSGQSLTNLAAGNPAFAVSGYQLNATARQLIFDFNYVRSLVREAAAKKAAACANLSKVQSDLILSVKQAFYLYAQNNRLVSVYENNLTNQQEHLSMAKARYNSGVGLPSDVVRAEAAVSEAILNLTQARNNSANARINLALLMGIDPRTPVQTAESPEPPADLKDESALFTVALQQRPEILEAQANLKASKSSLNAASSSNKPNLAGTAGWVGRGSMVPLDNTYFNAGLALQWSPVDGGSAAGQIKSARAGISAAEAQLQSVSQSVIADVAQAYFNLHTAEQGLKTSEAEVANATESLRLIEGRYRTGLGTFLDVLDAQSALLKAQTNRVNAGSALDRANAALAHALGLPLPQAQK